MTQKFGRTYRLTIYPIDGGDPIIIQLPLTINFSCQRDINSSDNSLDIEIYNLSEANRKRIYQDRPVIGQYFSNQVNPDGFPTASFNILLEAGYTQLYRVFYGKMLWASSAREGTNIITKIQAQSAQLDLQGTNINFTLAAGSTLNEVLLYLIGQFPNLTLGQMSDYPQVFPRAVALNGNAWKLLQQYSRGNAYIDNGKIYILGHKDVLNDTFVISSSSTGILNTPRPQMALVTVTTLLETAINTLGQQVQLQSTVLPQLNTTYKVIGVKHQGMISAAVCGKATSTFLLQSSQLYNGFNVLPAQ